MALSFDDLPDEQPVVAAAQPAPAPQGGLSFDDLPDEQPTTVPADQPWNANDMLPESLRPIGQAIDDYGLSLSKGMIGAAEGVTGIGDLLTGGRVSPGLNQQYGYDPAGRRAELDRMATPQHQQAMQHLDRAQGMAGTLQALRENPSLIPHAVAESLPSMALGGVAGRGIAAGAKALGAAPGMAGVLGAGAGEGVIAAGQQASSTVQENQQKGVDGLTLGQSGLALASGIGTGLLGAAGARIGRALGVADIDAQLAGANGVDVAKGLVNRALVGTGVESLEELTQSGQQQVLQNLANDRPVMEGVSKQMTVGGIVGGAMGGAAGLRRPTMNTPAEQPQVAAQQPEAMATPAPAPPPIPPLAPQPAPTVPKVPFAGSTNVRPLFESMGLSQDQMDSSLALLADDEPDIEAARRGTISWEETGRLAALTGTTVEKLRKHRLGVAFNAEEQVAATRLLKDQTIKTLDLSAKISSGNATELEQANFLQSLNDLRSTQKAVMASRAEIGRAMSAMRADVTTMKQAGHMLDAVGGAQGVKAIADALTNASRIGGVEAANKLARQAGSDGFWTFYKSMLLSSPDTHFVNVLSNLATSVMQVPVRALAGGIGAAKRAVGLNGETRIGESVYQLGGMLEGAINGARGAVDSWRTGEDAFGGENKAEVYRDDYPGQKVWGVPLRMLQSEDQFFKYLNDGMARYAEAYRMAAKELKGKGKGPADVHKRVQEIIANPPAELVQAGEDAALFHTFNNRAGEITQAVNRLRHAIPYGAGSLVIPFLKTPMNLVTYAVKHSPAAPIFKQVRQDLKTGGHRSEEALARMGIGSLLMALGVVGALNGNVSGGGPEDPEERRAWLAAGNQPYSLKINGQWQQYSRIEPMATLVGIAADVAHGWEKQELGLASLMKAIGRNFTSKTWLQGLSGVMQAMTDPDRYGGSWINRSAATLVQPATALSHIGRYLDPFQRETDRDSFTDQLAYRLPGLRESLPIKRDQFGAPLMEPQRQIGRAGPIPSTVPSDDPLRVEADRLGWAPQAMRSTYHVASKVQGQRGERFELATEQLNELSELANSRMHAEASALLRSRLWQSMDDDERVEALDKIMKTARSSAKKAFTPHLRNGSRGLIDLYRKQTATMARGRK
ncbi:hypothetical protein [Pseudomonas sp. p21]|uniref:hypothetical protein n=1 Tax=Pseudomonas sp. p21 TaxID=1825979 RepID=UPI0007C64DBF|nr:hypothetical protein [Pseudomonas sp. p21]